MNYEEKRLPMGIMDLDYFTYDYLSKTPKERRKFAAEMRDWIGMATGALLLLAMLAFVGIVIAGFFVG